MISESEIQLRISNMVEKYSVAISIRTDMTKEEKGYAILKYRIGLYKSFGFANPFIGTDTPVRDGGK
jgi:hypothetical protein